MTPLKNYTITPIVFIIAVLAVTLQACNTETKKQSTTAEAANTNVSDSVTISGKSTNIEVPGIQFTKAINGADTLVKIDKAGKVVFNVDGKKDYFADPNGELSNNTAPILLTEIDNKQPFTFTAAVTPRFTKAGMYNAGVLYIYAHDALWQKFCFEQDEQGRHRIVTVRTIGTSDDNNHDVVTAAKVYMKISSDTKTVASYYSLDNKTWQMVRLYKNDYPEKLWLGISAQCPVENTGTQSIFEDIKLTKGSVKDFRLGN